MVLPKVFKTSSKSSILRISKNFLSKIKLEERGKNVKVIFKEIFLVNQHQFLLHKKQRLKQLWGIRWHQFVCRYEIGIRTFGKQMYNAATNDLQVISVQELPAAYELSAYFLDLTASIRTQLRDCNAIPQLAWKIVHPVPQQYNTVFIVCDTYLSKSIKGCKRKLCGDGKDIFSKSRAETTF